MATLSEIITAIADAVEERDVHALRKISNKSLDMISLGEKPEFLTPALLGYAFAKIIQKPHYWKGRSQAVFFNKALGKLGRAAQVADSDQPAATRLLEETAAMIGELDVADKRFVKSLLDKSKLKISSTLYAQGFSLDRAVEMTGADKRELIRYIGKTVMFDRVKSPKSIRERLRPLQQILSA